MSKKLYWGLGVLFLLFTGVFVFFLVQQKAELNQWKADAAKDKPGYKLVKHGDHFHEVPIAQTPIEHSDVPIAEVSNETPVVDKQTPEEPDPFDKYVGKPIDEDFYRDYIKKYSREQLEEGLKSFQQSSDLIQTVNIPEYEEIRDNYLKLLESNPDNKYYKEGLARVTAEINWFKSVIRNGEELITVMSNVLNEEEPNVEK